VWYTKQEPGRIGRVTPGGEVTEFPLNPAGGWPFDIVSGPDGNLWFTEIVGSRVGRITPSGSLTSWQLTAGRGPAGIVVGSDGALWFAENHAGGVGLGRITTAGAITEFPAGGSVGHSIAPGPDGDVWFVDEFKVKRMSPSGAIAVVADVFAAAIARGPGATMWVVERDFPRGANLTQVKPSGELVRYPVARFPARGDHGDLAAGPGSTVWWAAPALSRLARLEVR
jgi:virginiamycin B lyase